MARKGKKKGVDGKACWEGYYYAGTKIRQFQLHF